MVDTENNVRDALERFKTAQNTPGFSHDIRLKLMYEFTATAEHNLFITQKFVALCEEHGRNLAWLKQKVEDSLK